MSGNKRHKLKPNIEIAKQLNSSAILSFGGPYSNHLHALAWMCKDQGLKSYGVVRGELHDQLTPTLKDCKRWGMQLLACQRKDYRAYQELVARHKTPCLAEQIKLAVPKKTVVIPEGGSNAMAIDSVGQAYESVFKSLALQHISHAICSTGTGATLAGLYNASPSNVEILGIQAVSEGEATLARIHDWINEKPKRLNIEQGHWGGFGKMPSALLQFIEQFEATYDIPLDPVYNGKAVFKIVEMIKAGRFQLGDQILFIHTGGLQGKRQLK